MLALHIAPHPDDESIGAPASLMALRDAGWRIVNLACSLGRPEQQQRRVAELREACGRARFELRLPEVPIDISANCDRGSARAQVAALVAAAIDELKPGVVISPGPGDRHHGHRVVREGVCDAIAGDDCSAPRWWMWALWGSLPQPTLGVPFGEERMSEVLHVLDAHRGELARTDYRRAVEARAALNAALAPEDLFGFGSGGSSGSPYVELLSEVMREGGHWMLGESRWLDPEQPLAGSFKREAAVSCA